MQLHYDVVGNSIPQRVFSVLSDEDINGLKDESM